MPQSLTYTTAQVLSRAGVSIEYLHLDHRGAGMIVVGLLGSDGVAFQITYSGAAALTMLSNLNTANLSVKSLHQRVLEKLATDGFLPAGTVSGTPS